MSVKLAILYYSTYGTNHQMAEIAAEAARAAGAEVRLLKVPETAPQAVVAGQDAWKAQAEKTADVPHATAADMEWANAYLISAPTRFGGMASQMRAFIDTLGGVWAKGGLANKAISAMTSAQNTHGGQESTLLTMLVPLLHHGCVIAGIPFTEPALNSTRSGGTPYGASHVAGLQDDPEPSDDEAQLARALGRRVALLAAKLCA